MEKTRDREGGSPWQAPGSVPQLLRHVGKGQIRRREGAARSTSVWVWRKVACPLSRPPPPPHLHFL
eukprot:3955673-Pyramimonas_sp.AAC.1